MRNRDNKKLKATLMVLLLIFVLGAAFAFTPGRLTIGGAVNLEPDDLYVQWRTTSHTSTSGVRSELPVIEDANGRTNQHIRWEVTFENPGTASLSFQAQNLSQAFDALIGNLTVSPGALDIAIVGADYGITLSGDYVDFNGAVVPMTGLSDVYTLNVHWDGRIPPGFDPDNNPAFVFEISYTYTAIF